MARPLCHAIANFGASIRIESSIFSTRLAKLSTLWNAIGLASEGAMHFTLRNNLAYTDVMVDYLGSQTTIADVVIDTGSAATVLSVD